MNGLNITFLRLQLSDWIKQQDPILLCLLEMQLIYTDKDKLKIKKQTNKKKLCSGGDWQMPPQPSDKLTSPDMT